MVIYIGKNTLTTYINVPEKEFQNWCRENDIKLLLTFTSIKKDTYEISVDELNFKPK